METLTAQEDSSGANPSSIKSDDSSPTPNSGRGSPPPNCAICLGTCKNKSFTDSCLHQFCFKCLLTWSKVKAECPLCKQSFRSIIHNVRSNYQYEEYMVEQRQAEEPPERLEINMPTRRFRYRTTLTLPRRDSFAIQQLLLQYPLVAGAFQPLVPARRSSPAAFRRTVYRYNLWARPLPDFTGRFRDCSPDFYRYNETQLHRLVPWLNRELYYLLNENLGHISYVLSRILELLQQYHINSRECRETMRRYFGDRTEHFLHELYCFASTPYDLTGYDRNVQYTTDTGNAMMVNDTVNEILSSESESSVDSDIVILASPRPPDAPAGPSRAPSPPAPAYPRHYIPPPPAPANVIPIETLSHSDSDDDSSEVVVVGYIKPPQDRTPEVVDLLGSDSDVVVQENPPPAPQPETERPPRLPIKLKLKLQRARARAPRRDSDASYAPSPPAKRRRASRSSTDTTRRSGLSTPSSVSAYLSDSSSDATRHLSDSSSESDYPDDDSDTDSSRSYSKRNRLYKKKFKKRAKDGSSGSRSRKKSKKRSSHGSRSKTKRSSRKSQAERDRRSKRKSRSGKGVKSTRSTVIREPASATRGDAEPQAGPSGEAGRRKRSRDGRHRGTSRDTKRLKSIVNVMYDKGGAGASSEPAEREQPPSARNGETSADINPEPSTTPEIKPQPATHRPDTSDSEDDLPLNLSIQTSKTHWAY